MISDWKNRVLIAADVMRTPGAYLSPTRGEDDARSLALLDDAGLSELIAVRGMISEITPPHDVTGLLHSQLGAQLGLGPKPGVEALVASREFAGRACSGSRRVEVQELVKALLDQCDENVVSNSWTRSGERVDGAVRHPDVLYVNDFEGGTGVVYEPTWKSAMTEGTHLVVGRVDGLPDDHRFRTLIDPDDLFVHRTADGRSPCLVLGPCDA
jgi:hypothetical protein